MSDDTDLLWLQARVKEMLNNGMQARSEEAGAAFAQAAATFAAAAELHEIAKSLRAATWNTRSDY